jgi:hypothetical protein
MTIWDDARESGPKRRRRPAGTVIPPSISPKGEHHADVPKSKSENPSVDRTGPRLTQAQHRSLVELTAYYLAEQRGFAPGHELEDWATAEILVVNRSGIPVA